MPDPGIEVSFYHHKTRKPEQTLPTLLERCVSRGWRVVVQTDSAARLNALNQLLWDYRPESFLPHGTAADPAPETQPIYLTCVADNPNGADVRFFVGALPMAPLLDGEAAPRLRAALLFDGEDDSELSNARAQWKELREGGYTLVYQQQDDAGRWVEKAREPKAPKAAT